MSDNRRRSTTAKAYLRRIEATNFRSLRHVDVEFGPLSVLVGPNGAGKSNLLRVIRFLGDAARMDLGPAIEMHGGFEALSFRGGPSKRRPGFRLAVTASVTSHASENALDEYELKVDQVPTRGRTPYQLYSREESFKFKRAKGRGRRIKVRGSKFEVVDTTDRGKDTKPRTRELSKTAGALSTIPRLGEGEGAEQVSALVDLFTTFRVLDIDVDAARRPAVVASQDFIGEKAEHLASFLMTLYKKHEDVFSQLEDDMRYMLPGFKELEFEIIGGAKGSVVVNLLEQGLRGGTPLADASFGTVRALALLAMLHDPSPPRLTCIEEVDHGLHPHALEKVVERMRAASRRTQLLIATHSPTLVNRLDASELIVCERDSETGESKIPCIDSNLVAQMEQDSELGLGELWFSGSLGGGLP